MSRLHLLFVVVIAACCVHGALAGELSPRLLRQLEAAAPGEELRVLVVLRDQVDAPALARGMRGAKAAAPDVHREVVTALRRTAGREQGRLVDHLRALGEAGGVRGFHSHWLINAVMVTATADAVRDLADLADVERVEADLVPVGLEPVARRPAPATPALAVGDGVAALGAPRVWRELGIDGTGVVIGVIDTGVDGAHPALGPRWRGHFAPPAECWLDAAELGDTHFPVDRRDHGTHVLGIMTGAAVADTIGVAPGALWIATNAINHPGDVDDYSNAVLRALEFMTDPDGDPSTSADVPAVVHNSWGVRGEFDGYDDCDSRWWDAMDACEAAGVVLTWSVGNEGPSPETIRSPADRAASPLNAFSVGSTGTFWPFAVSGFSSRGPSQCGGPHDVKPEVAAPGEEIRSAAPGGHYQVLSGTSMAGPHVAGVVALMRQANPDADVATLKQILMDTARDLGTVGEDNDTGWGLVDAYEAVLAVRDGVGTVSGLVTSAANGSPLAGATVTRRGSLAFATTDGDGRWIMTVAAGPATFDVEAFGHEAGELPVVIPDGDSVTADLALTMLPASAITGHVRDVVGAPLAGATVSVLDTPLPPAVTTPDGAYELEVPRIPGRVWTLRANAPGHGAQERVTPVAPAVVDFFLATSDFEDFETGDFTARPWRPGGDAAWTIDEVEVWQGRYSARSDAIGDGSASELKLEYEAAGEDSVVFHLRVSSEAGYDQLRFLVDGVLRASWSGEVPWRRHAEAVGAGPHSFTWSYRKDAVGGSGQDAAWLDDIALPASGSAPRPAVVIEPAAIRASVVPGATVYPRATILNTGQADLHWSVLVPGAKSRPVTRSPAVHVDPAKGQQDPRRGPTVISAAGGPDAAGRIWLDSRQPGGPVYVWRDIGASGTELFLGDDEVGAAVPLGFDFPWDGGVRDSIRVASDGFLALGPAVPSPVNQPIPDPAAPNDFLAPFWDDLDPSLGGRIFVQGFGDRFVVQFEDVAHFAMAAVTETFQAVLHADGQVEYFYRAVGHDGRCTVGLENDAGDDGLQVLFNSEGFLADSLAVLLTIPDPAPWLAVDQSAGMLAAGAAFELGLTLDATGLVAGDHSTLLHLATDDPERAVVTVPVHLTVDGLAGGTIPPTPVVFHGPVPNPFNPTTNLSFELPRAMAVRLDIFDLAGRRIRELTSGTWPAGHHEVPWDGRDGRGHHLASGVYFARLVAPDFTGTHRLVLIR